MTSNLHAIGQLMLGERARYGAAIGSMVIASALLYVAPLVPQIALDGVLMDSGAPPDGLTTSAVSVLGGREYLREHLWVLGGLIVGVTALAGLFTYLRSRWSALASERIIVRLRDRVFDHLQRLPCRFFDDAESGDLIQRCTSDVETVRVFLETQVVEIVRAVIMVLVPIPLMLAIDPRMTVAALVLIPVVLVSSWGFFRRIKTAFTATDEAEAAMTATLQENLTGIRVVRAFARQEHECARFEAANTTHRERYYELYRLLAGYWASTDLLAFMQKASVVAVGLWLLASGELRVGAFFFFITATTMFVYPVRMLGRILTDLGKAMVAIGRLHEILDEPIESSPERPATLDLPARGDVRFEGVSFDHGSVRVLDDLSFDLPAGGTLGLVGPSGAGKSTIIELLMRLYDCEHGRITLDGVDVRGIDRATLREQLAVVMQQPFLYSKTLAENVTIGRPDATEAQMHASTEMACIHGSILEFEDGYTTAVGERGVTLSGGQRQRVALARALLQRPAVLVLDDSLSAVDTETETHILDALRERRGTQTTIVIAHRLSSVMEADQILVLEGGRVTQRGTHNELARRPGLYRRLWTIQNGGELVPDELENERKETG